MPDPTSPPHVPYQAYKSKRHSRNLSNTNLHLISNEPTPSVSRPISVAQTPPTSSPLSEFQLQGEGDNLSGYGSPRPNVRQSTSSPKIILAPPSPVVPVTNGLPSPPASSHSHESSDSPADTFRYNDSPKLTHTAVLPDKPVTENAALTLVNASRSQTQSAVVSTPSSPIASGSTTTPVEPGSSAHPLPKTSRFRHVPLRKKHAPHPSSPLASASQEIHSRASSVSSLPPPPPASGTLPVVSHMNQSEPQLPGFASTKALSPAVSPKISARALPVLPPSKPESSQKPAAPIAAPSLISSPMVSQRSSSSSDRSTRHEVPSTSFGHRPGSSRSLATSRLSVPYRPGFQPKGVYRHLTDDFLSLRKLKRDGAGEDGGMRRVERNKLERRLEKLIALHFPIDAPETRSDSSPKRQRGLNNSSPDNPRASAFFDLDALKNINIRDPGGLWKNALAGSFGESTKVDIRAMEQRITPWEEDSAVSRCPLCLASFHPLTNRRHHCRLCGRLVCSLPPKQPQRPATCSLLFVVDSKTRRIEEVDEGVDYGVRRRRTTSIVKPEDPDGEEKFLKGVRVCRECRPILLRQQYQQERMLIPTLVKLHEAFIALERDIEEALPQFQELVFALSHDDHPTKEASAARKRLLETFARYDALAKKIQRLPCPNGKGSSQERVQAAILMRANTFLQKNMFPLQSLPNTSHSKGKDPASPSDPGIAGELAEESHIDPDSELASMLQPLLEQEALLESFVEEAKAQRKFEDVKTLKTNLQEIRREIEKLFDRADVATIKGDRR